MANVEQSKRLVAELKRCAVPHLAHFERGEGHGMAWLDHRVALYEEVERFLAANLAPKAVPAPAAP